MPVTIKGNTFYDWSLIEAELQRLLNETAWTQLLDSPLSEPSRLAFAAWRLELWQLLQTVSPYPAYTITIPPCPIYWAASAGNPPGLVMPEYEAD